MSKFFIRRIHFGSNRYLFSSKCSQIPSSNLSSIYQSSFFSSSKDAPKRSSLFNFMKSPSLLYSQNFIYSLSKSPFSSTSTTNNFKRRIELWNEEKEKQNTKGKFEGTIQVKIKERNEEKSFPINVTPLQIGQSISKNFLDGILVCLVDGKIFWDLNKPLQQNCEVSFLGFDSNEGKEVFWHSTSHVLGYALEKVYGDQVQLCDGPAIDKGFFYEFFAGKDITVSEKDFPSLEKHMQELTSSRVPFERLEVSKEFALNIFSYNPFKQEILQKIPDNEQITLYKCGDFIDLCRGPHLPHTGLIKAFSIVKNSGSYWLRDSTKPLLQRVYGISFPDKAQLKQWFSNQEKAQERDHRVVGKHQELFFFHEYSPGSAFFLPHGTRIFNKLQQLLRKEYHQRGYAEVITPIMFDEALWKKSGHYDNYKEEMFSVTTSTKKEENLSHHYMLKPMNCPSHCLIFANKLKSHKELPIRLADFGALHRNEFSGALAGLTRVRKFHQDDAHIFCREDQIGSEIKNCLQFLESIYGIFGFEFQLELSTRPKNYIGELQLWDKAEEELKNALKDYGRPWQLNPEDGAFYGPKIDVKIMDALARKHQCATIQLDFQLPIRFNLKFMTENNAFARPVMIHRALLGSLERMIAILTEHTGGKWPLWISPRQVMIIPVSDQYQQYAAYIHNQIVEKGYYADIDYSSNKLGKKVREAQVSQYNFIVIVGDKEAQTQTISVRSRDNTNNINSNNTNSNSNTNTDTNPLVLSLSSFLDHLKQLTETFK